MFDHITVFYISFVPSMVDPVIYRHTARFGTICLRIRSSPLQKITPSPTGTINECINKNMGDGQKNQIIPLEDMHGL